MSSVVGQAPRRNRKFKETNQVSTAQANPENTEVAKATPAGDGSDSIQSLQTRDNPLHTEAIDLLNARDARNNFPSTASTVSLAAIDNTRGVMSFQAADYGSWDPATVARQFDQTARADFPTTRRDVTSINDRTPGALDQNLVTTFKSSMQQLASDRGGKDTNLNQRVDQFLERVNKGEIKPEDANKIMKDLIALQKGDGVTANGIQNADTRRAFVAGLLDNVAQPEKIDQTGTNTCNATTVQEQIYKNNPAEAIARARRMAETGEYTANKVDAKGNLTNEVFSAKLPPSYFKTMDQLAAGDQTANEKLNVATSGVSVGMLNHFYQQRGLYYNIEKGGDTAINNRDTNGEYLAKFTNGTFTNDKTLTGGPDTDAYAVADMGRSAGLKGAFVLARDSYLRNNREHTGVARIKSDADMQTAMNDLQTTAGVNSAIMVMNVGNVYTDQRGGHVVSITRTPDNQFRVSDQNANSALEDKVKDHKTLFAWMNNLGANERPVTPDGEFLDQKEPDKSRPTYDRPGITPSTEWNQRYGDTQFERAREEQRIKDQMQNPNQIKKAEGDQDKQEEAIKQAKLRQEGDRRQMYAANIRSQINALEARLRGLEGSTEAADRSQVNQLSGRVADLTGNLIQLSA
jgi:hypothetical protein